MKIWKVILATLVIFCAGVLAGARLVQMRHGHHSAPGEGYFSKSPDNSSATNNPAHGTNRDGRLALPLGIRPGGRNLGKEFLERLDRELNLDPDQHKQIEKILEDSQKRAREVWKKIEPEMREEMKNSRDAIRATLNPEQAAHFEELMKRAPKPPKEGQSTNGAPPAADVPPPLSPSTNPPVAPNP